MNILAFRNIRTGSSARKLKREQANLLPGRIHQYFLGPLTPMKLTYLREEIQLILKILINA
jgi:predicted AAA+ superfamily ATPase